MRKWHPAVAVTIGLFGASAGAAAASPPWYQPSVRVSGAVASPADYSLSALATLPQSTFSVTQGDHTVVDQGVSLETLVDTSAPQVPSAKNALLRVIITVKGQARRQRTFALGELDPNFGNHPAYLALDEGGQPLDAPELIVPGDKNPVRSVPDVSQIGVAIESPAPLAPPEVGALTIEEGASTIVLSPTQLAALPQQTLTVTFFAGPTPQTDTETGPTLDEVLRAAHIQPDLNTWVAGVGSDGYVATVTPAEAWVGGRPLMISLVENGQTFLSQGEGPRLVTDGDIKGGRYDSGMYDLVVGDSQPHPSPWWR